MSSTTESDTKAPPLTEERIAWWRERITHFPEPRAVLLPLLHDLQDHNGCLDRETLLWAAAFVGISPVEAYGVATFYWMYDFEPRAKHCIAVCHNISCDLRGKDRILEAISQELGIQADKQSSADGEWSMQTVECMGACTSAPMMAINGEYFENLTPEKAREILAGIRSGEITLPPRVAALPPLPGGRLAFSYDHPSVGGEDGS